MFILSEKGYVNSDYVKEICIRNFDDKYNPQRRDGLPFAIVAVMDDGSIEILREYETKVQAYTHLDTFAAFLMGKEKDIDKTHLFFTFEDDFIVSKEDLDKYAENYEVN